MEGSVTLLNRLEFLGNVIYLNAIGSFTSQLSLM